MHAIENFGAFANAKEGTLRLLFSIKEDKI